MGFGVRAVDPNAFLRWFEANPEGLAWGSRDVADDPLASEFLPLGEQVAAQVFNSEAKPADDLREFHCGRWRW